MANHDAACMEAEGGQIPLHSWPTKKILQLFLRSSRRNDWKQRCKVVREEAGWRNRSTGNGEEDGHINDKMDKDGSCDHAQPSKEANERDHKFKSSIRISFANSTMINARDHGSSINRRVPEYSRFKTVERHESPVRSYPSPLAPAGGWQNRAR